MLTNKDFILLILNKSIEAKNLFRELNKLLPPISPEACDEYPELYSLEQCLREEVGKEC